MKTHLLDRLLPQASAALLVLSTLAPLSTAQDENTIVIEPQRISRALESVGVEVPTGLEPVRITEMELKRALVYTLGTTELESRKVDVFIAEEIERQVEAGGQEGEFGVSDEEVASAVEETLRQIREQYPTLDEKTVLEYNKIDPTRLSQMTLQSKMFEKVFLPENPEEWPATTLEAIRANAGEEFVAKLQEGYEQRKALQADGQDAQAAAGQAMFQMLMRQMVMQALNNSSTVQTGSDGLPADVAMRVNGVDIATEEVYSIIEPRITAQDRERAETWATKVALLEAVMRAQGTLLSDEEFEQAYAEHAAPFEGSPLSLEVIKRNFEGYPSMEAYRTYFRLYESFKRTLSDELANDATFLPHMARADRLLGVASIDVEVILCSAFDFPSKQWKENGWESAAEEARQVARALVDSDGSAWSAQLEEVSGFWDPPAPTNPSQQQQPQKRKNNGRFGTLNRNELMQYLEETKYRHFVDGYSLADAIFFDLEPGEVGGPWRGPYGYYFARVNRRVPPVRNQSMTDPNYREMVADDYATVKFNGFARAIQEAADANGQ